LEINKSLLQLDYAPKLRITRPEGA